VKVILVTNEKCYGEKMVSESNIHQTAIIAKGAKIGRNVVIGPNTIIGKDVVIGDNTVIQSNCELGVIPRDESNDPLVIG
jgi:UDP-3-O-[3-hydroxymyristoyl] glucosamine N-acyltransferase